MSAPDCYKNKQLCDKDVYNYRHALEFDPECCKTHEMWNKGVDTYPPTTKYVPECYKTQKNVLKSSSKIIFCILFCF